MGVVNFMKLFVIGNGFDLEHGLNTQYKDFKEYLIGMMI